MQRVRPGPRCFLYVLAGLAASFFVPAVALCGWLRGGQIAWAIVAAMLAVGAGYLVQAHNLARSAATDARIPQLLLAGVLVLAAGLLWASLTVGPGPIGEKRLDPTTVAVIMLASVLGGVGLVVRHARRLMRAL